MGRYQSQLIRTGPLMKARASAQPRLLASANDRQPVESQSQKPLKRPARKVVFNACENCRVRKTKCSGTAPCTYCTANQIDCIFTGRAHERTRRENIDLRQDLAAAQQDLHDTQRNLATSERELRACHQSLSTVRHELLECQHDLSTSQVMFLESQQHVRDYVMSLGNIFDLLRISKQSIDANLRQTAMKSQDAAEFLQKMSTLPADVQQEVNLLSSCYADPGQLTQINDVATMPPTPPAFNTQVTSAISENPFQEQEDFNTSQFTTTIPETWHTRLADEEFNMCDN